MISYFSSAWVIELNINQRKLNLAAINIIDVKAEVLILRVQAYTICCGRICQTRLISYIKILVG